MTSGPVYLRQREMRRRKLQAEIRAALDDLFHSTARLPQKGKMGRARVRATKARRALDKFESERVPLALRAREHGGD